ncbi:hypothetical protein RKD27_009322 [Streptomyces sp. SAI-126]|uniref:hypothetical protein n=1 Tax=unclassified Streptomyces TaxID=2593676 RepID=UPI00247544A5|nr:hypothetical protein [Streptomyces sp. SAI-119]MDH6455534.1 hypothetical protein [Streptomyces sp. SAI-119]
MKKLRSKLVLLTLPLIAAMSLGPPASAAPTVPSGPSTTAAHTSADAVPVQVTAPSPTAAAACWPEGTRLKKTTEGRVYLIGPGNTLYWIPDTRVYFNLWATWDGLLTVPDAAFDACYSTPSLPLQAGRLAKESDNSAVYIYDNNKGGYRWIPTWDIFANKYHFDPAAIETVLVINPAPLAWT